MDDLIKIIEIAKENNNIFKTKMVVDAGIRKEKIRELLECGKITRIGRGYYVLTECEIDVYDEIQKRIPRAIYSYETAAYLLGLLENSNKVFHCSVPRGYNTSKLNVNYRIKFHYVIDTYHEVGVKEIKTPDGNIVRIYDKERTICDFIRHRKRISPSIYSKVLNNYFKGGDMDILKLVKYGRLFRISKELDLYIDVL